MNTLTIAGNKITPGERKTFDLPVARLYTHTDMNMPVHVYRGRREGPCLFVSAALHGDEILGVEIIQRLIRSKSLKRLRGTLIAIPIVNIFGFIYQSRYLPDRRDLNRSFPGAEKGSLAAQLAYLFMHEIVSHCTHGIDLHTGSNHRTNLPQIRACMDYAETARLAKIFGAPVILHSNLRDGSLRQAVQEKEIPMLLYEAGEALRFSKVGIRMGLRGILSVMRSIGMLPADRRRRTPRPEPVIAKSSLWERAPISGILTDTIALGAKVSPDTMLGIVSDPFGEKEVEIRARASGLVIGRLNLPLVHKGDAVCHIARFKDGEEFDNALERLDLDLLREPDESWMT